MVNEHWKNCSPEDTVARIDKLMRNYDLTLKCMWAEENNLGVYANTIRPFGQMPCFKTGGKGITPDYALASGYAEFIERFQTFMTYYRTYFIPYFADETINPNTKMGQYPYLNLLTGEAEILSSHYTYSTGMASGNTDAEAIVHAICEVVERQSIVDFIDGKLQVNSRLPLNYFNLHFEKLEDLIDGKVQLFDVGRFGIPTVAMICRNEMTKQLLFKIDCGPTLELAAERCLTEFFQNNPPTKDMKFYQWQGMVSSQEVDKDVLYGVLVDYHVGPIPYDLIEGIENAPVREEVISYTFETEKDLIQTYINSCKKYNDYKGLYLRDFKWAGFPTVYLYIQELIDREHQKFSPGELYSSIMAYMTHEYELYNGDNPAIIESLMRQLVVMYLGKGDPVMISKRYNNQEVNTYVLQLKNMIEKMKESCKVFSMDIENFKSICL